MPTHLCGIALIPSLRPLVAKDREGAWVTETRVGMSAAKKRTDSPKGHDRVIAHISKSHRKRESLTGFPSDCQKSPGRCRRARKPSDCNRIRRLCRRGGSFSPPARKFLTNPPSGSVATRRRRKKTPSADGVPLPQKSGRSHFFDTLCRPGMSGRLHAVLNPNQSKGAARRIAKGDRKALCSPPQRRNPFDTYEDMYLETE